MREGEVIYTHSEAMGGGMMGGGGMMQLPGVNLPRGSVTEKVAVNWKEKTGRETGWLVKGKEEKTLKVKGMRCTDCGFVELYVQE